jgi:hypothetical protein
MIGQNSSRISVVVIATYLFVLRTAVILPEGHQNLKKSLTENLLTLLYFYRAPIGLLRHRRRVSKMLIISRKKDQKIVVAEEIEITILEVGRNRVRFGIKAPKHIPIQTRLKGTEEPVGVSAEITTTARTDYSPGKSVTETAVARNR